MTAGWEQPQSEPSQCHLHPGTHAAPQPEAGKTDKDRGQREGSVSWCSRQEQSRDLPPSWGMRAPNPSAAVWMEPLGLPPASCHTPWSNYEGTLLGPTAASSSGSSSSSSEKLMCRQVSSAGEKGSMLSVGLTSTAKSLPRTSLAAGSWQLAGGDMCPFSPALSLLRTRWKVLEGTGSELEAALQAGVLASESKRVRELAVMLVRLDTLGLGRLTWAVLSGLASTSRLGEVLLDLLRRMGGGGLSLGIGCCRLGSESREEVMGK